MDDTFANVPSMSNMTAVCIEFLSNLSAENSIDLSNMTGTKLSSAAAFYLPHIIYINILIIAGAN
jgi:hypothetical protein